MAWRGIASDGYLCSERVTLHGVVGGGRYALPGACTPENGWTLNGVQFQVENILGRHLLCLERGADGSWVPERESDGRVMLSAGRVIAVKSRLWEVADRKMDLILAADSDHRVWVELGIKELPFTGQSDALTVPPADVSDVSTPPTPPPDWDARSSRT